MEKEALSILKLIGEDLRWGLSVSRNRLFKLVRLSSRKRR